MRLGGRTTLGRNGSNYSAALLANFLEASLMENYTHVDGIYTANPSVVAEARKIDELSYADAAELSQFGAEILHIKTIEPLQERGIPLRVLNTFSYGEESNGTLVTAHPRDKVVRALASLSGKALIHFEGRNMLGALGDQCAYLPLVRGGRGECQPHRSGLYGAWDGDCRR